MHALLTRAQDAFRSHASWLAEQGYTSLSAVAAQPFRQFRQACREQLGYVETRELYLQAQRYVALIRVQQRKAITHANPQLTSIPALQIQPLSASELGYDDLFDRPGVSYVSQDSVASLFSPAAYLTELYAEGRQLHADPANPRHLDTRRPDLKTLTLSQSAMDEEVTTLSLSNDIVEAAIGEDNLSEAFSQQLHPFALPYHQPFSAISATLAVQDSSFARLAAQLAPTLPAGTIAQDTRLAFSNQLSPGLVQALSKPVPTDADDLANVLQQHYGTEDTSELADVDTFCQRAGISRNELNDYLALSVFRKSAYVQGNDRLQDNTQIPVSEYGANYLNTSATSWLGYVGNRLTRVETAFDDSTLDDILQILPSVKDGTFYFSPRDGEEHEASINYITVEIEGTKITSTYPDTNEYGSVPFDGYRLVEFLYEFADQANPVNYAIRLGRGTGENIGTTGSYYPANLTVTCTDVDAADLVRLSQIIRYCQHTGLSPALLNQLIQLSGNTINAQTLTLSGLALQYQAELDLDEDDAAVLAGNTINVYAKAHQLSQFDRLFNNPPLHGTAFRTDDAADALDLNADSDTGVFQRAVLKRAFAVNDAELTQMGQIVDRDSTGLSTCDVTQLTDLYFVALLAHSLQLTIAELDVLLHILNLADEANQIAGATLEQKAAIVLRVSQCVAWLRLQNLSVTALQVMTTQNYPTTLTPEIARFIQNVYAGVQDPEVLQDALAPYIAGALKLTDQRVAWLIESWIDQVAVEQGLALTSMEAFWQAVVTYSEATADDPAKSAEAADLAQFCQALAQLGLICRTWNLQAASLNLVVQTPAVLQSGLDHMSLTWANLALISRFYALQQAVGEGISELLTRLSQGELNSAGLATLLQQPQSEVERTAALIQADDPLTGDQAVAIHTWLARANQLGIASTTLYNLLSQPLDQSYADWQTLAGNWQAGLSADHATQVTGQLDEQQSTALCAYYQNQQQDSMDVLGIPLANRDNIFQYLLIDNQVSSIVTTTRLSEAIASVQLYINRCLQGLEENADRDQLLESFFVEWDTYNRRYSTWAGVSELAYYPENYVDPLVRYNQTSLQKQLLSETSQSQLSADAVETAYLNYLDGFEDIANLKVLCGYHHAAEINVGKSYFVGRTNAQPYRYFWRSLDHAGSDETGGYVASAWTEWEEITAPIQPMNDEVRPVMFNNRIYVGWMEETVVTTTDGSQTTEQAKHSFKLSYRKINGSWSPASSYDIEVPKGLIGNFDLYLSYYALQDALLVLVYDPTNGPESYPNKNGKFGLYVGGFIYKTMAYAEIPRSEEDALFSYFNNNLNNRDVSNKVIRYINADNFSVLVDPTEYDLYSDEAVKLKSLTVTAEVDNLSIPPVLRYEMNATVTVDAVVSESKFGNIAASDVAYTTIYPGDEFERFWVTGYEASDTKIKVICKFRYYSKQVESWWINELRVYDKHDQQIPYRTTNLTWWALLYTEEYTDFWPEGYDDRWTREVMFSVHVPPTGGDLGRYSVRIYFNSKKDGTDFAAIDFNLNLAVDATYSFGEQEKWKTLTSGTNELYDSCEFPIPSGGLIKKPAFKLSSSDGIVYRQRFTISTIDNTAAETNPADYQEIVSYSNQAIYLGTSNLPYRTRLNTLFANELILRASQGLDNILSWETQQLPEPQLGEGFYAEIILSPYNLKVHGPKKWFKLHYNSVFKNADNFLCYEGVLSDTENTVVTIFYPYPASGWNKSRGKNHCDLSPEYSSGYIGYNYAIQFEYDPETKIVTCIQPSADTSVKGIFSVTPLNDLHTEPMDFSGANGLYFWELFYYTPMLVAQNLLQAQNFTEAQNWLNYIFNPQGYIEGEAPDRHHVDRIWNVRPLQEDTAWDDTQTDSTDPDIVAQADPMHYKVSTYMTLLDLLIARGDMAYRQLERDTLNEAKMWYVVALNLLGDEPDLPLTGDWADPMLGTAALTSGTQNQSIQLLTANSLTGVFAPPQNDKLHGYWQTLQQRLYNLRHNLSIDGQPLTLPVYATPADPEAIHSAAAASNAGSGMLGAATLMLQRFQLMLEGARGLVGQLIQYGNTLSAALERKDAEALQILMQTQAQDLIAQNIKTQTKTIEQLQADQSALAVSLASAESTRDAYQALLDEGISQREQDALDERISAGVISTSASAMRSAGAALDLVPNIFGFAVGGTHWGAIELAIASGMDASNIALSTKAEAHTISEQYRRRAQDWTIQRDNMAGQMEQIQAQQASQNLQIEAAQLQQTYLETQQAQLQAQLEFMQGKFTNEDLYSWMQGRLSALFYQFYDLTVSRCLQAQAGYQWETKDNRTFVQTGAWSSNYAGLLSGEALMLNLAQMESAYLAWDNRALEVRRTISMATEMASALTDAETSFVDYVNATLSDDAPTVSSPHSMDLSPGDPTTLVATINLSALDITGDYPEAYGAVRRMKQVSVSLPALLGPYQDIQAVLSYSGQGGNIHQSCRQTAISHGVNDTGQFQLDFNDTKYLPFEGLPINEDDSASLTLSFPNATEGNKQYTILQTLNDIIVHLCYTIRH